MRILFAQSVSCRRIFVRNISLVSVCSVVGIGPRRSHDQRLLPQKLLASCVVVASSLRGAGEDALGLRR